MTTTPLVSFHLGSVSLPARAATPTATFAVFSPVHRLELDILTAGDDRQERTRGVIRLEPVDGGTRLDLTVDGLSDASTAENMRTGWQWCLEGIARLVDPAT